MPKVKKNKLESKNVVKTWKDEIPNSTIGEIIFAKCGRSSWWPGIVVDASLCGQRSKGKNHEWVYWYEDGRVSFVSHSKICSFREQYLALAGGNHSNKLVLGIKKALKDCAVQDGWPALDLDSLYQWASSGFPRHEMAKERGLTLSVEVSHNLASIKSSMTEENPSAVEILKEKESDSGVRRNLSGNDSPDIDNTVARGSSLNAKYSCKSKLAVLKSLKTLCIACRDTSKTVCKEHPLFYGGICDDCEDALKRYMFALDEDGFMVVCSVCGNSGELLICDKPGCRRVYCTVCIVELISKEALNDFRLRTPWICLLCKDFDKVTDGLLFPREDWWGNVTKLFTPTASPSFTYTFSKKEKGIRVLSLFDGISAGYYALSKLKIAVDCYYASEIDEKAITVSKYNFPGKISYIGDVECLTSEKIAEFGPIDLIIGGSPCNDLSAVNPARKGLYAGDGTGRLFFEFFRVLKTVQELSGTAENPVFWMYENVASMPAKYRGIISRFLGCEPALINAKDFSAQHRPRFFWSSIPGVTQLSEVETNDCPTLSSAMPDDGMRVATVAKINTVTTQKNSLKTSNSHPVLMNGEVSSIWITELEEVFGFPRHFTDVGNFSTQQRLKLLGKSWSVAVIKNIFSPLRHIFAVEK